MRTILAVLLTALLGAAAQAQSLQLTGKFGYLGEYELSAQVAAQTAGAKDYAGPMTVTHVGLCTHDGPNQLEGRIKLQFAEAAVTATLAFDGRECTFHGPLSQTGTGEMVCPGVAVPFSLWSK